MFDLKLRQFEVFVAVVDHGGFARAADRLGIAQPSISAHVKSLERDLGTRLFDRRSGHRAALTAQGQAVLGHARGLLAGARGLVDDAAVRRRDQAWSLSIVCQRSLASTVLKRALGTFVRDRPEVRLRIAVESQEGVIEAVRRGPCDVGYLLTNQPPSGLAAQALARLPFVLCVAPSHPLATRQSVDPADLSNENFVGSPRTSRFGEMIEALLGGIGVAGHRLVAEATEFGPMRDLTIAGLGFCCALEESVRDDIESRRLVVLRVKAPPLSGELLQLTRAKPSDNTVILAFAQHIEQATTSAARDG